MEEDKKIVSAKNIIKSPITSIAGLILLVAGIYSVMVTGHVWTEGIFPIGLGCMLMVAPDQLLTILKNKLEK